MHLQEVVPLVSEGESSCKLSKRDLSCVLVNELRAALLVLPGMGAWQPASSWREPGGEGGLLPRAEEAAAIK